MNPNKLDNRSPRKQKAPQHQSGQPFIERTPKPSTEVVTVYVEDSDEDSNGNHFVKPTRAPVKKPPEQQRSAAKQQRHSKSKREAQALDGCELSTEEEQRDCDKKSALLVTPQRQIRFFKNSNSVKKQQLTVIEESSGLFTPFSVNIFKGKYSLYTVAQIKDPLFKATKANPCSGSMASKFLLKN